MRIRQIPCCRLGTAGLPTAHVMGVDYFVCEVKDGHLDEA